MTPNQSSSQFKVLWVTNVMPPYRLTLWEHLGNQFELTLVLVEGGDPATVTMIHNSDWRTRDGSSFKAENLQSIKMRSGDGNFHISRHMRRIATQVSHNDVLVLGAWESPVYWQYLIFAKLLRKPVVLFHESTDKSSRFDGGVILWIKSKIFGLMEAVVVPGAASRRSVENLGVTGDKIFEGFNAIDMDHFRLKAGATGSPVFHGDASEGHRFIYVGQLIERKQVDLLIREFARIRLPGDQLSIVGKGKQKDYLIRLVDHLELSGTVVFIGEVSYDDLPAVLSSHHTLVLPSRMEVWGLVVNEALACGLQVVVSARCGVADSIRDMAGVIVWDEDQQYLGDALLISARQWRGTIQEPEILQFTNERFAAQFVKSFLYVIQKT